MAQQRNRERLITILAKATAKSAALAKGVKFTTMNIPLYIIDTFTSELFTGNTAGVCPLVEWLPEQAMMNIAAENAYSETAFFVAAGGNYELRWFTPTTEVELCGHATLASAFVVRRLHWFKKGES